MASSAKVRTTQRRAPPLWPSAQPPRTPPHTLGTAGSPSAGSPSPRAPRVRGPPARRPRLPSFASRRAAAQDVFYWIELVCVVLFTIDYAVRILTCPKVRAFVFDPMNMVDLAAVLPFWIMFSPPGEDGGGGFGFVRVIRLVRVFRVFKLGRYSVGLQMFGGALKGSVQPLGILIFVMSINMIILSSIVHICELGLPEEERSDHHMRCFGTISRTFWWAMVTMTTVGYGDCYPLSDGGKVFAVVAMLSGVLILALPITVIGSNFAKMVEMFEEDAAAYAMTDEDGDGMVDEMELREVRRCSPPTPPGQQGPPAPAPDPHMRPCTPALGSLASARGSHVCLRSAVCPRPVVVLTRRPAVCVCRVRRSSSCARRRRACCARTWTRRCPA